MMSTTPLEIIFTGMDRSEFIEHTVTKYVRHVEKHFSTITNFHVTVAAPHKSHRHGNQYDVHVVAHIPGSTIAVSNHPGDNSAHVDMQVAIRDAFRALESLLQKQKTRKSNLLTDADKYIHDNVINPES